MTWTARKGFQLSPFLDRSHRNILAREGTSPGERLIALGALLVAEEKVEATALGDLRELAISSSPWKLALARYLEELETWSLHLGNHRPGDASDAERARQLLSLRHECELSFWAARHLEISDPLSPEDWGELKAADDELREMLPRLIPENEWRQQMLSAINPAYRKQFFWFELGHMLPSSALERLDEVDALLRIFPELDLRNEANFADSQRSHWLEESRTDSSQLHPEDARSHSRRAPFWILLAAAVILLVPLSGWILFQRSLAKAEEEKAALVEQLAKAELAAHREVERLKAHLADAKAVSPAQMETLREALAAAEAKAQSEGLEALDALPCADRKKPCPNPAISRPLGKGKTGGCPPGDPLCVD